MKKTVIISIGVWVFFYLLFSFVMWKLNPYYWPLEARFFFVFISTMVTAMVTAIAASITMYED